MIHYMLLPGYVPATCHKNNIDTLLVTSVLYYRNITCFLGSVEENLSTYTGIQTLYALSISLATSHDATY